MSDDKSSKRDDTELLARARQRFDYVQSVEAENRDAAKEDVRFAFGRNAQWPDAERRKRQAKRRPVMEFNQCPQFIRSITNDARTNKPAIKVRPTDEQASKEIATIYEGIVRAIENDSNAPQIYVSAHELAVAGGFGFWRIVTEYVGPNSFDQKIVIKPVANPFACAIDPDYTEPDACDARWGFVTELIPVEEFKRRWPDADAVDFDSDEMRGWLGDDGKLILIADYYERNFEQRELLQLNTGEAVFRADLEKRLAKQGLTAAAAKAQIDASIMLDPEGEPMVRMAEVPVVTWYKITGAAVLERHQWAGEYIPIVMCVGEEMFVDDKRVRKGAIANAKDPQRLYNYMMTTGAEMTGHAPRVPWVGAVGAFSADKNWKTAHSENHPYLEYKPIANAPPPSRTETASGAAELITAAQAYKQDLKSTVGIYDPSLGNRSNETSGRAILAREAQGDVVTYHFRDNLANAIKYTGRVIVDLIPKVYDRNDRKVRTRGEDGQEGEVVINKRLFDPQGNFGGKLENNLRMGRYDVIVDTGPSFQTRRQESAQSIMEFGKVLGPNSIPLIADKIAKNMDWPGADEIAKRLALLLPPAVQQMESQEGQDELPPQARQMMMGLQNQVQTLTQQVQQLMGGMQQAQGVVQQKDAELKAAKANNEAAVAKARADERKAAVELRKIAVEERRLTLEEQGLLPLTMPMGMDQPPGLSAEAGGAPAPRSPRGGGNADVAIANLAQVVGHLVEMQAATLRHLSTPTKTVIEYDAAGNPVAAVKVPAMVQ